jgi:hypothetical protein
MREIGEIIDRALTLGAGHPELGKLRERSRALAAAFPLYPEIPA